MSKNNKKALVEQMNRLKGRIAQLRESNKPQAPQVPSVGLAVLIESELDKASLLLNAKDICNRIQKMAQQMANVEADDLMPVTDEMKSVFGPEKAEAFYTATLQAVRGLMDSMQQAKNTIQSQIAALEGGQNDMAMTPDAPPAPGDDIGAPGAPGGDDLGDQLDSMTDAGPGAGDEDFDPNAPLPGEEEDGADLDMEEPAPAPEPAMGRGRKESAQPKGRVLEAKRDPDSAILESFKEIMRTGAKPHSAARRVAEQYRIDVTDVKEIVKEAARRLSGS